MITKNVTTRLTDILATIAGTPHFPAPERARVHAFVTAFVTVHYPAGNANTAGYKAFSNLMTMTDAAAAGSADIRAMRRAIFLLWYAMGDQITAARAKMILAADVQTTFVTTMQKALCHADTAAGNAAGTKYVFKEVFRANPLQFLQRNKVFIAGVSVFDPNSTRNMLPFVFEFDAGRDRYDFSYLQPDWAAAGRHTFDTTSVPAAYWGNVPGRTTALANGSFANIRGTEMSGKYMVTTQFTGCAFCLKITGAGLFAAHISPGYKAAARVTPTPGIDATVLAQQLCGTQPPVVGGDFGNAPAAANPFRVLGKSHSNMPGQPGYDARCVAGGGKYWMTLIGFNRGNGWEIYCQEVIDGGIGNAYRVW